MNFWKVMKKVTSALSISFAVTTLGTIGSLMICYMVCFMTESTIRFPFGIINIVTVSDGDGHYTNLEFEFTFFWIMLGLFIAIAVVIFLLLTLKELQKKREW